MTQERKAELVDLILDLWSIMVFEDKRKFVDKMVKIGLPSDQPMIKALQELSDVQLIEIIRSTYKCKYTSDPHSLFVQIKGFFIEETSKKEKGEV